MTVAPATVVLPPDFSVTAPPESCDMTLVTWCMELSPVWKPTLAFPASENPVSPTPAETPMLALSDWKEVFWSTVESADWMVRLLAAATERQRPAWLTVPSMFTLLPEAIETSLPATQ